LGHAARHRTRTRRRIAEEAADAALAVAAALSIRGTARNNCIFCFDESSMFGLVDIAWINMQLKNINMQLKNIEDATTEG